MTPEAFYDDVAAAFQDATRKHDVMERHFRIVGRTLTVRFAGTVLVERLTRSLEHLAAAPAESPDLVIEVWDRASTGVPLPPPPWTGEAYTPRGDILGFNNERIRTAYNRPLGIFTMMDAGRRTAVYCSQDAGRLHYYEMGSPFRVIFHWWLGAQGYQFIHAGAVGTASEGGVLLVGRSGAGKSTTALTCLASELSYVSEDFCLLRGGAELRVHGIYNSAKVRPDNLHRVPHLRDAVVNAGELDARKAMLFLHRSFPDKLVPDLPVRYIVMPRVSGREETTLTPALPADALAALALSTVKQLPGAGKASLDTMQEAVQRVPCCFLEAGTRMAGIPETILRLLRDGPRSMAGH
jgi:hypothetical protein